MELVSSKIIDTFLQEAVEGRIQTDPFIYNVKFSIGISEDTIDSAIPVLRIRDKEKFRSKVESYMLKMMEFHNEPITYLTDNMIKVLLSHLFANATYADLLEPEIFIDKYMQFMDGPILIDNTISNIFNSTVKATTIKQPIGLETPYAFVTSIEREENGYKLKYRLPRISFGIANNVCYIYAIQNDKVKEESNQIIKFQNKIKRLLYKINNNVMDNETDEYLEYKEGLSDYYPENISDVSPSAILSLTVFLNAVYNYGVSDVKVISLLPIRYNAKEQAYANKLQFEIQKGNLNDLESGALKKELREKQLNIQNNLTQKLLRNFNRLKFHFSNIDIVSYPFEVDECMHIKLGAFLKTDNPVLEEIISKNSINSLKK